jgi:regulator of replication initiation timing
MGSEGEQSNPSDSTKTKRGHLKRDSSLFKKASKTYTDVFSSSHEQHTNANRSFTFNHDSSSFDFSQHETSSSHDEGAETSRRRHSGVMGPHDKQFHKRFPDLPEERVVDNFICALLVKGTLLLQGSMYITENYVCFYSNIGKKVIVQIKLSDVIRVRRCKILKSIPNSIEIHTNKKKYFWASFIHRDNAYRLIDSRWRVIRKREGNPVIDQDAADDDDPDSPELELSELDVDQLGPLVLENSVDDEIFPPITSNCCHEHAVDLAPRYTELFPLSVREFYLNFLSEKSILFWIGFHSKDGYNSFKVSKWSQSVEGCCLERQTEFRMPIHNAIHNAVALNYTRVTQQQRCRFISEDVLIFETSSHSLDVPFSNQFLVESRWEITNSGEGWCELNISISVRFVKKIWFKLVIERNAIDGSREWFENWIKSALAVTNSLKRNANGNPSNSKKPILEDSSEGNHSSSEKNNSPAVRSRVPPANPAHVNRSSNSDPRGFTVQFLKFFYLVLSDRTVKWVVAMCFFLIFFLIFSGYYLYSSSSSLSEQISQLTLEETQLEHQYQELLNEISALRHSNENLFTCLNNRWQFWQPHGTFDSELETWKESLSTLTARLAEISARLEEFGQSVRPANADASFYSGIASALNNCT